MRHCRTLSSFSVHSTWLCTDSCGYHNSLARISLHDPDFKWSVSSSMPSIILEALPFWHLNNMLGVVFIPRSNWSPLSICDRKSLEKSSYGISRFVPLWKHSERWIRESHLLWSKSSVYSEQLQLHIFPPQSETHRFWILFWKICLHSREVASFPDGRGLCPFQAPSGKWKAVVCPSQKLLWLFTQGKCTCPFHLFPLL